MGKILDELVCDACGKKLSKKQQLFDTGWLGVHWCGEESCAADIMQDNCDEMDPDDSCNHED
jgi:hypothetical protein